MTETDTAFHYVINHIFLPPRLPSEDDFDPHSENFILRMLHDSLQMYRGIVHLDERHAVDSVLAMITNMESAHDNNLALTCSKLITAMKNLSCQGKIELSKISCAHTE
jgi:hypothetical protein